ncbi:hypothetical protein Tco_0013767 [Tanacetum coccineum]
MRICEGSYVVCIFYERLRVWNALRGCQELRKSEIENSYGDVTNRGARGDDVSKSIFWDAYGHVKFTTIPSCSKEEYESHSEMIVESLKEEKIYVKVSNKSEADKEEVILVCGRKSIWLRADLGFAGRTHDYVVYYGLAKFEEKDVDKAQTPFGEIVRTLDIEEAYEDKVFFPSWSGYDVVWF